MDDTDLLKKLKCAEAKMAFLTKALKIINAAHEDPITEEEGAGFKLFFDAICEDFEAIRKELQRELRAAKERKAQDLISEN